MSEESWKRVQSLLKENLSKSSYEKWIRPTQFRSLKNGKLTLIVPNIAWFKNNCSQTIQETAEKVFGEPVTLKVKVRRESINKKDRERDEEYYSKLRDIVGRITIVDPPLKPGVDSENLRDLRERLKKNRDSLKKIRLILSDPEGAIEKKEAREKRWEAEKLKARKFRQKTRRYLFAVLIIIGAILVILRG